MSRKERIESLRNTLAETELRTRLLKQAEDDRVRDAAIQEMNRVWVELNVEGELQELRDEVWEMGSLTIERDQTYPLYLCPTDAADNRPLSSLLVLPTHTNASLIAFWPKYRPAYTSSGRMSREYGYVSGTYHPPAIESDGTSLRVKMEYFPHLGEVVLEISHGVRKENPRKIAVKQGQQIDEEVLGKFDEALTEISVCAGDRYPLTLCAGECEEEIIEHIGLGEFTRSNLPEAFKKYMPEPKPEPVEQTQRPSKKKLRFF